MSPGAGRPQTRLRFSPVQGSRPEHRPGPRAGLERGPLAAAEAVGCGGGGGAPPPPLGPLWNRPSRRQPQPRPGHASTLLLVLPHRRPTWRPWNAALSGRRPRGRVGSGRWAPASKRAGLPSVEPFHDNLIPSIRSTQKAETQTPDTCPIQPHLHKACQTPAKMPSIADEFDYKLDHVKTTSVSSGDIDKTFRSSCIDLVSAALGGKVLAFSDQWFAEAANLLTPTAPIHQPGKMVFTGAWFDGWETRRHNADFDWVVIRLGVASGTVEGIEIDTAFFTGNYAPAISVEGCFSANDDEVVSWQGGRGKWETILGVEECGPSQRFGWKLDSPSGKQYTHVRLNMYPDGGIARFRLFGHAVPVFPDDKDAVFDLAAAQNGGVAVSCSDQHFGTKDNLLLPGRGKDMGDGWETKRTRGKDHVDWAIIKLGAPGYVHKFVADTAHYRGNFPQKVAIQALSWKGHGEPGDKDAAWQEVVAPTKMGPDAEHELACASDKTAFTHVKLIMIPDGGVKRLRAFGRRAV
ncbi:hypothetical protein Purlil1_712 [Purpureocillium lilacinum]|uniref:Allantoicase domain-containing protein n=2 Tax=Purpureocillium lilacinum TaxID=33203 RepID=A0ABR0CG91_PURLI|nr:hypothetical protein Purlil1_712 [Purpureocillium lilacinum]